MKSRYEEKFKEGARPYLEAGEEVLAAFICQPRGHGPARAFGAAGVGLVVSAPMVLAVTQLRLLSLKITTPVMGHGGDVQRLLGAVPLADVDAVEIRRFGLGKRITVIVRGDVVRLDGVIGASEFLDAFTAAKAAA
jgi:hypothetical protein